MTNTILGGTDKKQQGEVDLWEWKDFGIGQKYKINWKRVGLSVLSF